MRLLIPVLLLLSAVAAFAQDRPDLANPYTTDVWRTEDGLPQNTVLSIVQSRDGYLWLGTQEGVVRFDGSRFGAFEDLDVKVAPQATRMMVEDDRGLLWIGTEKEGLLAVRDGVRAPDAAPEIPGGCVQDLLAARDGSLWIGTCESGLFRMRGGELAGFTTEDGLAGNEIKTLAEDHRGRIWVGTYDGLSVFDGDGIRSYRKQDGLRDDEIFSMTEGSPGVMWIGTRRGLQQIEDARIRSVEGFERQINALAVDAEGSVWVGTNRLWRFTGGELRRFGDAEGVAERTIRAIYPDGEGSVWLGTVGGGLQRLRVGSFATLGKREGLSHDMVSVLHEDDEGFWIGTWGGGLNRIDADGLTKVPIGESSRSNAITSLFRDSRGHLWIGTPQGVQQRMPDGSFRAYGEDDGIEDARISAIGEDADGVVWVGTVDGLHRRTASGPAAFEKVGETEHDMVHALVLDSTGTFWIGRDQGLTRIRDGHTRLFTTADGLADDKVFSVHEDADGALWIGTAGGVSLLEGDRIASVTKRDGLCDNRVFWILEDDSDRLWMSCNQGVFSISKDEVRRFVRRELSRIDCTRYGRYAGMRSQECNGGLSPAGCRTRDGRLWFPTVAGVVAVRPGEVEARTRTPRVALEDVFLDQRRLDPRADARLRRGQGELEFHYTAIELLDPREVRFRYRLDGFEEAWRDVGDQRVARYTNLPAGDYRFHLAAASGSGPWSEAGVFAIRLTPRFYQRPSFLGAVLAGLVLLGSGAYAFRIRQLRVRQHELARLVEEKTQRLEEINRRKSEFVSGISHELRTPLSLVRLYAETLLDRPESPPEKRIGSYRIIAREVERLTRLVERVLDVSRIEEGIDPHRPEPGNLAETVTETVEIFRGHLETRGFNIDLEIVDDPPQVIFDPAAVSNALTNLLDNAAKYSGESTSIRVRLRSTETSASIEVEDRGPGIPREEQERIFERFHRVGGASASGGYGIGLYLVRGIMEAHGGSVEVDSTPGRGSIFRLIFPVG